MKCRWPNYFQFMSIVQKVFSARNKARRPCENNRMGFAVPWRRQSRSSSRTGYIKRTAYFSPRLYRSRILPLPSVADTSTYLCGLDWLEWNMLTDLLAWKMLTKMFAWMKMLTDVFEHLSFRITSSILSCVGACLFKTSSCIVSIFLYFPCIRWNSQGRNVGRPWRACHVSSTDTPL